MTQGEVLMGIGNLQWFAVIVFAAAWLHNAAQIWIGGNELERIVVGLRGNVFEGYRRSVAHRLSALSRWIRDEQADGPQFFSGGALLLCLGVAAIYPALFVVAGWALAGASGSVGELSFLPPDIEQSKRLLIVLAITVPAMIAGGLRVLEFSDFLLFVGALIALVLAFALAYAGASGLVVAGAITFAVAAALAGAAAVAGAVTAAFAIAFAAGFAAALSLESVAAFAVAAGVVTAVVVTGIVDAADRRRVGWFAALVVAVLFLAPAFVLAYASGAGSFRPPDEVHPYHSLDAVPVMVLLTLLPAVNAPFDWASLGATRWLLSWFANTQRLSAGFVGLAVAALVVVATITIALALSAALVAALAAAAALFSQVYVWTGGQAPFDVVGFVARMRADPGNPDWWWVYAMIFTTLIPAFVHFLAFARAFVTIVVLKPLLGAQWIADGIERAHERKGLSVAGPSLLLTILQLGPGIAALALAWAVVPAIPQVEVALSSFADELAYLAMSAAQMIQP